MMTLLSPVGDLEREIMNWLEIHIGMFFKINAALLALITIFLVWGVLQLGIPPNNPTTWTPYQWDMVSFLWKPTFIHSLALGILSFLCLKRKYVAFLITAFFLSVFLDNALGNIIEIYIYGFVYPTTNLWGIFTILEFILSH